MPRKPINSMDTPERRERLRAFAEGLAREKARIHGEKYKQEEKSDKAMLQSTKKWVENIQAKSKVIKNKQKQK